MNKRVRQCARQLCKENLDSLLISDPLNILYLTGFANADGYLLLTSEGCLYFFTNFLYMLKAKEVTSWEVKVAHQGQSIFRLVSRTLGRMKHKKVGFESKHLNFLEHKALSQELGKGSIDFRTTIDLVENIRMIKEKGEIALIKKSIAISLEAFDYAREIFEPKMTEKLLSIEIEKFLRLKGDNKIAFETIVASGRNTVFPHHSSGNTKLDQGFSLIDLGSRYYDYCADLTRIFFWSKMPHLLKKMYDTVRKAQDLAVKSVRPGVTASYIDKKARDLIAKKGWGKYFGHGLGHGVGLAVHEPPYIGPYSTGVLQEGMVITIEPAIYLKRQFGVRVEDMILVTRKGGVLLSGNTD